MMKPVEVALAFVEAVNRHDVPAILSLMSEDHVFVDTYHNRQCREEMAQGWLGYFAWFPDYRIEVDQVLQDGNTVGLFGFAGGTYGGILNPAGDNRWRLPAVWRVVAAGDKVKVWQVYCDSKIPYEIINRESGGSY